MIEKAINYSFDALYKYIKEKKAEERRKEIEAQVAKKIASFYKAEDVATEITYKSPVPW